MANRIEKITIYLAGPILGILTAGVLYFGQPVNWVGQVLLRVGQLSSKPPTTIESVSVLTERLKSPSFIKGVIDRTKRDEIATLLDVGGSLLVKPIRNADRTADSLEISVTAESQELARIAIEGVVAEIELKHDQILQSYLLDYTSELAILKAETEALSKRMSPLAEKQPVEVGGATGFLIMTIQSGIDSRGQRIALLKDLVSSAEARPTKRIETVSVTERRRFPSFWRICLLGILLGGVLNIIWLRLRK